MQMKDMLTTSAYTHTGSMIRVSAYNKVKTNRNIRMKNKTCTKAYTHNSMYSETMQMKTLPHIVC